MERLLIRFIDIISDFTTVEDASQMPLAEICSECYIKKHQMMQQSAYSAYDDVFKLRLETINSRCSLTAPTSQPPSLIVRPVLPPPICASGLHYTTSSIETCDTVALSHSVSSAALFMANGGTHLNCSSLPAELTLCLPVACSSTYTLKPDDTCESIQLEFGLPVKGLQSLNPWIDFACLSLHTATEVYGSILCVTPQGGTLTATAPVPGISIAPGDDKGYAPHLALPPANATVATGTTPHCGKWHEAATGETCAAICVKEVIYIALFLEVNPSLNLNDCTSSLVVGKTYCVGPVVGWEHDPITETDSYTTLTSVPSSSTSTSTSTTSISTSTTSTSTSPCQTVSGLVSPTPSGAICGQRGTSHALAGAGTIVSYTSGSPYVSSIAACGAQCVATGCCTAIYFIKGSNCNLKYGPRAFDQNVAAPGGILFDFYDLSCFTCTPKICTT